MNCELDRRKIHAPRDMDNDTLIVNATGSGICTAHGCKGARVVADAAAGYSAFFNVLSKATQDDIIDRTEQVL